MKFLLFCAVSYVSFTSRCASDGYDLRHPGFLRGAEGFVAGIHTGGRRSWRRPQVVVSVACHSDCGIPGASGDWGTTSICCTSFPCGAHLQFGAEDHACERRRRLGKVARSIPIFGSTASSWKRRHKHPNQRRGTWGKETEDDSGDRSVRRRGVHRTIRGGQIEVVPTVFPNHRWLAARGRRPYLGAGQCVGQEDQHAGHFTVCGLWSLGAIWIQSFEGEQIQVLRPHGQWIRDEGVAGTCNICAVEIIVQDLAHCPGDAGRSFIGITTCVRDDHRAPHKNLPVSLAPDLLGGRVGPVVTLESSEVEDGDGRQGRENGAIDVGPKEALGFHLQPGGDGRQLLATAGHFTCFSLDCGGQSREAQDASRAVSSGLHERWSAIHNSTSGGSKAEQHGPHVHRDYKDETKEWKEKTKRWRWRRRTRWERKPKHKQKRKRKGDDKTALLWLEQWKWPMCWFTSRATVRIEGDEGTPLHNMPISRSPVKGLHEEERVKKHGEETESTKKENDTKGPKAETNEDETYSYTYETEEGSAEEDEKGGDEEEPEEQDPLLSNTLEEFYNKRVFTFIHHFAGCRDPLSKALKLEAIRQGIKIKVISVEKESGSGDLASTEPYTTHLRWARRGYVDGYHAGFPCSTFSRLRHRVAANMPGPVRTKSEPYGRRDNTEREQVQCDEGTILACRAIDMAVAVAERKQIHRVPPVSTLENPPPSDCPEHISAWELPEMDKFLQKDKRFFARFNTCRYESGVEIGKRHFKPQQFAGSLLGLPELSKECSCGKHAKHEPVIGPTRSKASAEYPEKLCREYAILAISQLKLMGKEEFLKARMSSLQDEINQTKAGVVEHNVLSNHIPRPPSVHRRRSRTPLRRPTTESKKPGRSSDGSESPPKPSSSGISARGRDRRGHEGAGDEKEPDKKKVKLESNLAANIWKEGEGKYGTLKASRAKKSAAQQLDYLGGMRDPFKVVRQMSNLQSIGVRIRAAWEAFEREVQNTNMVAETYGTKDCVLDPKLVEGWKAKLKKVLGAQAPKSVRVKAKWMFTSPLEAEIFKAWVNRGNDPETHVARWIEEGAPLGIEVPIEVAGVFPLNTDDSNLDFSGSHELEDAATQLSRGEMVNYISVQDNVEEAKIELDRYRQRGFLVDVPKGIVESEMAHGTISRLGLIIKEKPEGIKRRIILDLRRSGGNRKSTLPEKLVLPRPKDAVEMMREVYKLRRPHGSEGNFARELVVIDISDAYMSLGLDPRELPHALAPNVANDDFYLFSAMLFGFKTAPSGHEWRHWWRGYFNSCFKVTKGCIKFIWTTAFGFCREHSNSATRYCQWCWRQWQH